MSRKRGEFEHRTSIFEGSYRAWSYLGGLEPTELETKSLAELDPLCPLAEARSRIDPRLDSPECKEQIDKASDRVRRLYPYEPLPRSGLGHPFVAAILSLWLGPEADEEAVESGLTTLRTWWQHRRKGESGSAIAALGSEKMQGVVDGYTRHFFSLAYYVLKNDKEPPPRTLFIRQKELEKERSNQVKKKPWNRASFSISLTPFLMVNDSSGLNTIKAETNKSCCGVTFSTNAKRKNIENLSEVQQCAQVQSHVNPESSQNVTKCPPNNHGSNQKELHQQKKIQRTCTNLPLSESCCKKVNNDPGTKQTKSPPQIDMKNNPTSFCKNDKNKVEQCCDDRIPIVLVSSRGDIHIAMKVDGMTCLHCVKIVETVLKGCSRKKPPIKGLLDAAADLELGSVIIKIDKSSNAKRIAEESSRNMGMVGYNAKVMDMSVDLTSVYKPGLNADLGFLSAAFEVLVNSDLDVFDWSKPCSCRENGLSKIDCKRHSQINARTFQAFRDHETHITQYISGCGKRWGGECTCEVGKCMCSDCGDGCKSRHLKSSSVSANVLSSSGCCST